MLQGDVFGRTKGSANIEAAAMTDAVWDFVFLDSPEYPASCGIPKASLQRLRHEFRYWYPCDLRGTARELVKNHYLMAMYNHCAVFGDTPGRLPASYYVNGHVLVNGAKMSKSIGTYISMEGTEQQLMCAPRCVHTCSCTVVFPLPLYRSCCQVLCRCHTLRAGLPWGRCRRRQL